MTWAQALAMMWLYVPSEPPPVVVTDINLFPSAWTAKGAVKMSREHVEWLEERLVMCRRDQAWIYREWLREAVWRRDVWGDLLSAHWCNEPGMETSLLYNLNELRDKIGHTAFYNGRLPHPLPLWRFREP